MSRVRGFLPYIFIVFFNSFVDLGHKILIQNTLYQTESAGMFSLYSSIVNALILLPYVFLFTPSGFIADRFSKTNVLRITALGAIPLTLIATWSYYNGYFKLAFFLTLLLAIQSVINSPAKYGYIKEIYGKASIARVNAFVQTTTIIAILAGTFIFSLIFNHYLSLYNLEHSTDKSTILKAIAPAGFILVILSVAEAICSFIIPKKSAADPDSHYEIPKYVRGIYLKEYLFQASQTKIIFMCILGLSVFWGVNQVLLASYGAYLKDFAGNPNSVFVQGALGIGGIGILLGATYAGRVSRGFIEAGMIPCAAIGSTIGLFFLPQVVNHGMILLLFIIYGFFGGMLVVPLNALIQFNAKDRNLGKTLAVNNFMQTVFMLGFLLLNILFTSLGGSPKYFIFGLFIVAVIATIYALISLPQSLVRYLIYFVVSKFYRVQVYGIDNLPSTGGVLLLGNHTSYLDWAILQIASPRPIRFVMERAIYQKWYLNWLLSKLKMIPISVHGSKNAMDEINQALQQGEIVALFPEGRLSRNGQIGYFHNGFEKALKNSGAAVIPFYLLGLWGSVSSHATERYRRISGHLQRRISVTFGTMLSDQLNASQAKQQVQQLSISAWKQHVASLGTVPQAWLRRVKQMPNSLCLIDSTGTRLSSAQLLSTVMYMQYHIKPQVLNQKNVGILLPAGIGGVLANLVLLCLGKTVVNLNFTSSLSALEYAIKDSNTYTIITSRVFVEKLIQRGYDLSSILAKTEVVYLEDFKKPTSKIAIIRNFIMVHLLPLWVLKLIILTGQDNNATAAILFSSGSEGKPKGIELTHRNILGNIKQVTSVFNIREDDVILSTLPLFHAFGLTVTTFMPLCEGTPMICHPDPTDAVKIGKLIYQHRVTVMCGTSTFFGLYNRNRQLLPQMFESLRLVIAGAEKLNEQIRKDFKLKFNKDIYEGYGATEVAPVASSNLPDELDARDWHLQIANRIGSVGLPLPGTAFKIVDPSTLEELPMGEEGMVLIGGTQVMNGYLNNPTKTKEVLIPDGDITWYVTGDKGRVDEDGYLTIVDRYSRFAKIGGEMISLSLVEQAVSQVFPDASLEVMALSLADDKKGEKIILLHTGELNRSFVRENLLRQQLSPLYIPAEYISVAELPKLGSGKKDYVNAKKWLLENQEICSA